MRQQQSLISGTDALQNGVGTLIEQALGQGCTQCFGALGCCVIGSAQYP